MRRILLWLDHFLSILFFTLFVLFLPGCAAQVSMAELQARNPGAFVFDVCRRPVPVSSDAGIWAYRSATRETVTDRDPDALRRFASSADAFYRLDPNAPQSSTSMLPWPYHHLSCQPEVDAEVEDIDGQPPLPISDDAREVLAELAVGCPVERRAEAPRIRAPWVGQQLGLPSSVIPREKPLSQEQIERLERLFVDALRKPLFPGDRVAGAPAQAPEQPTWVKLVLNGAATTCNGARSLVLELWRVDDSAPASTPSPPPAAPAQPPATPAQPPAPKPTKVTTVSASGNVTTVTLVKYTGQWHHAITKQIHKVLERHKTLKGLYKYRDERFKTQGRDLKSHNGYDTWHRQMEPKVIDWLKQHDTATPAEFESWLREFYTRAENLARFPNGL